MPWINVSWYFLEKGVGYEKAADRLSFSKLIILFSCLIFAAVEILLYSIIPHLWSHIWVRPDISYRELWWILCSDVLASISTEKLYSNVTTTLLYFCLNLSVYLFAWKKWLLRKSYSSFIYSSRYLGLVYISRPKAFTAQDSHLFFLFCIIFSHPVLAAWILFSLTPDVSVPFCCLIHPFYGWSSLAFLKLSHVL